MNASDSILDKIIQSNQLKEASQFNPSEVVSAIFRNLSAKEKDILARRFGLFDRKKETLEQIGKQYNITRERIRQIEVTTIKKLRELEELRGEIELAEHNIVHLLQQYGGIMEENHLLNELLAYVESNDSNRRAALFILSHLLKEKIERVKQDQFVLPGWKLPTVSTDLYKDAITELVKIITDQDGLVETKSLLDSFKEKDIYKANSDEFLRHLVIADEEEKTEEHIDNVLQSLLKISKNLDQNILGEWGLTDWQTVAPKRMSDKAYLVLRKEGKPLHFTEITEKINQAKFDKKVAYPATIHNELILDDRYVLVGRGIYALKEWGYQSGTVIDIIVDVLKAAGRPMTKDEIVDAVLKQRMVRKSTIYLALTTKDKIKKLGDGTFAPNA